MTLGQLYAENISDLTFLVFEEERLTFAEVHDRAMRLANALRTQCGIAHGGPRCHLHAELSGMDHFLHGRHVHGRCCCRHERTVANR